MSLVVVPRNLTNVSVGKGAVGSHTPVNEQEGWRLRGDTTPNIMKYPNSTPECTLFGTFYKACN